MMLWRVMLGICLAVACASGAEAVCSGASPNWSCSSWDDMKALVEGASIQSGDTATLGAGTFPASSTITVPSSKKITLSGSGVDCPATCATTVNASVSSVINIGTSGSRVTQFKFLPTSGLQSIRAAHTGWRVDHCLFDYSAFSKVYAITLDNQNLYAPTYLIGGLIDSNTLLNSNILVNGSARALSSGAVYYHSMPFDLGGDSAVYIEDNTFSSTQFGNLVDANRSGAYVVRFNTFTKTGVGGAVIEAHSLQSAVERGTKKWEIYKNTITHESYNTMFIRGGSGVVWGNTIVSAYKNIDFDNIRSYTAVGASGMCDATNEGWDSQEGEGGSAGWLCRDQIGAGSDVAPYDGSLPLPVQEKRPAYLWENGVSARVVNGTSHHIRSDIDYYDYSLATGSPQTTGVRTGTKAQMPAGCTTGVAYWVTDEGYWGSKNDTPTVTADGVLYKCTATNYWTPFYVPYPYPHPLRSGLSEPTGVK